MSCCDDAVAQGFADCEVLVSAFLQAHADRLAKRACDGEDFRVQAAAVRSAAIAISLGQHRSAETNESAVLSAHRTAVNRAQAQAGGRAAAAKRWGPRGEKS